MSKPHAPQEVKPTKLRHPFSQAFSPRRMSQDGFDRRMPARPRAKTLGEILATPRAKLRHGHRWGDWRLNAENLTLELWKPERPDCWSYYSDLEMIHTSAAMLDWIFQVRGRLDAQQTVDLLRALHSIFNPQATLCPCGVGKRIKSTEFLRERIETVEATAK